MNARIRSRHCDKENAHWHKVVGESAYCNTHVHGGVAAVSSAQLGIPRAWAVPYKLDVPSMWAISERTLEVVDRGVASEGNSCREVYPKL